MEKLLDKIQYKLIHLRKKRADEILAEWAIDINTSFNGTPRTFSIKINLSSFYGEFDDNNLKL